MTTVELEDLQKRVRRLEDEASIRRMILSYGPAADAGLTTVASQVWADDGIYDWDADGEPYQGAGAVDTMLRGDGHQGLIAAGIAHFAGPPLIKIDADTAAVITYSLIMRHEEGRFYLWRVSAARWDCERQEEKWKVRQRTNRLLDATGGGRNLLKATLQEMLEGDGT